MSNHNNDQDGYFDFSNSVIGYNEGDVVIFDHVEVLSQAFPLKPKTTLLGICCKGKIQLIVNGKKMEFGPGDAFICPPNVKVEDSMRNREFECKAIGMSDSILQGLLRDRMEIWNHMVYINQTYKIALSEPCRQELDLYYALFRLKLQNKTHAPSFLTMQSLLRALLLDLCVVLEDISGDFEDHKPSQGKMLFNRFLSTLSNNEIKRQPIATYASQLAITPKYLTMLCLKYSKRTASDWVIQYTVEDIRFFLKNSNLSIKEISAKLGFTNMSHFGSYVRKNMGMSPSELRHRK